MAVEVDREFIEAYTQSVMTSTAPTQAQVDIIAVELAPDVERIRLHVGEDFSGDPALYFRVLLSDEASRKERLAAVARTVRERLSEDLQLDDSDRFPYFRFRSKSEQAMLREAIWE